MKLHTNDLAEIKRESGVLLVREAELDALVEKHAHEWGVGIVNQDADFEVTFANQL